MIRFRDEYYDWMEVSDFSVRLALFATTAKLNVVVVVIFPTVFWLYQVDSKLDHTALGVYSQ